MARKLEVEIVGDASKLNRQLNTAGSGLGKFAKVALLAGGAAGLGAVVLGAKHAINAASNLNESINAVNVVFGKASGKIHDFSKKAAREAGLSMRELNELVTPLGAAFTNLGDSQDVAARKSIALAKRAADMASVFNVDVKEALGAIQAGLRGEADPLERFGVGLSDAAVTSKALQLGLAKTKDELTASDKAQARYKLLMEQTNKVAGDFKNTSGGLANQQRILKAEFENFSAAIGQKLLPAVTMAVLWIGKNWPAAAEKIKEVWVDIQPSVQSFADSMVDVAQLIQKHWGTIGPILTTIANIIKAQLAVITGIIKVFVSLLKGDWQGAWNAVKNILQNAINAIKALLTLALQTWGAIGKRIGVAIKDGIVSGVTGAASAVWDKISDIGSYISARLGQAVAWGKSLGTNILNGIKSTLSGIGSYVVNLVKSAINALLGRLDSILSFSVDPPGPGPKFEWNPDIPRLAAGGIVTRPTLAMVGERGPEAVIPLRSGRGAPMQVNLQLDGRTLASLLVDPLRNEVRQLQRAGGTL